MANVERLPSGHYRVTVQLAGRRARGTAATKREAMQLRARLLADLQAETAAGGRRRPVGTSAVPVSELLDRRINTHPYSPTTATDLKRVRDRLPAAFLATPVTEISVVDLDRLYDRLAADGWSPNRIRRAHNLISVSLDQARRWQWIARNPARDARPPKIARHEATPAPPSAVGRVLEVLADDPAATAYVRLAATTGARRGELVALRWADIDLEAGRVAITKALIYTPTVGIAEKATKTDRKGRRVVSIDPDTIAALRRLRVTTVEALLAAGLCLGDDAWVFSHRWGITPWRPDYISRRWHQACAEAGVTGVRLHDLRHLVATELIAAGVDPARVAGRLGHARVSTTLDTYAHWLPERDREAADIIAARLRGAG